MLPFCSMTSKFRLPWSWNSLECKSRSSICPSLTCFQQSHLASNMLLFCSMASNFHLPWSWNSLECRSTRRKVKGTLSLDEPSCENLLGFLLFVILGMSGFFYEGTLSTVHLRIIFFTVVILVMSGFAIARIQHA
jgi:hypothetical protein